MGVIYVVEAQTERGEAHLSYKRKFYAYRTEKQALSMLSKIRGLNTTDFKIVKYSKEGDQHNEQ